jgi:hypothetical protein
VIYEYFAAESDDRAASTIDLATGPGGVVPVPPGFEEARRTGDFAAMQRLMMPLTRISEHGFAVLTLKGIDPFVQMGTLEALLTGREYDAVTADTRSGHPVAEHDGGMPVVVTLTDALQIGLADASPERLAEVAAPWSHQIWGHDDPADLTHILGELAKLARGARDKGHRLYCWICV